jgi:ketol-acid reductoisomerase
MAAPDESQPDIYKHDLAPHMKQNAALLFVHGFAIHFHRIEPNRGPIEDVRERLLAVMPWLPEGEGEKR